MCEWVSKRRWLLEQGAMTALIPETRADKWKAPYVFVAPRCLRPLKREKWHRRTE